MQKSLAKVRGCTALLWVALTKINREERRQGDLSFTAFSILKLLHMSKKGKIRMQDLAKLNGVSKSTVTDYVDNLEEKGYVIRKKDMQDQRGLNIALTEKGERLAQENEDRINRYLATCSANLTDAETEQFAALFSKFMGGVGIVPFESLFESVMDMEIE